MNEYMKPDYEVMVFEANEYVAACPWVQGTEFDITCGNGKLTIKLSSVAFDFTKDKVSQWYAQVYNPDAKTEAEKWSGSHMLFPIFEKNGYSDGNDSFHSADEFDFAGKYGFQGHINSSDHITEDDKNGETRAWDSSTNINSPYYLASNYTDATGYTWNPGQFHLLSSIMNKNNS